MKINIKIEKEKTIIDVKFTKEEREILDKKMERLSLERSITKIPFGLREQLTEGIPYWRNTTNALVKMLCSDRSYKTGIIDDVNKPFIYNGYVNIAIFRIMKEEFSMTMDVMLPPGVIKNAFDVIREVYKDILSMFMSYELSITINEKEKQLPDTNETKQ